MFSFDETDPRSLESCSKSLGVYCGGVHLFPFRTEKLSPPAQMVLLTAGEYVDAILRALERGPFFYALCRIVFALINELRCSSSHHP